MVQFSLTNTPAQKSLISMHRRFEAMYHPIIFSFFAFAEEVEDSSVTNVEKEKIENGEKEH